MPDVVIVSLAMRREAEAHGDCVASLRRAGYRGRHGSFDGKHAEAVDRAREGAARYALIVSVDDELDARRPAHLKASPAASSEPCSLEAWLGGIDRTR